MKRHVEKIPAFTGAAFGTQPTSTLVTRGRSLEYIDLQVIGTGPSSATLDVRNVIASVEVLMNGKVESVYYPKETRCINDYTNVNNDPAAVDFIRFRFGGPASPTRSWAPRTSKASCCASPPWPRPRRARRSPELTAGAPTSMKT